MGARACLVVLCTTYNREMETNNKEHQRRRRTRLRRRCCLYSIIYNVFIWFGSQDPFRAPQVQLWSETELQSCLEVSHRGAVKLSRLEQRGRRVKSAPDRLVWILLGDGRQAMCP